MALAGRTAVFAGSAQARRVVAITGSRAAAGLIRPMQGASCPARGAPCLSARPSRRSLVVRASEEPAAEPEPKDEEPESVEPPAAPAATATMPPPPEPEAAKDTMSLDTKLSCPICFRPLASGLSCGTCKRTYTDNGTFMDLTVEAGINNAVYEEKRWSGTSIFETEWVSFAYERGWRQSFSWAGFPGEAEEFKLAMEYLRPSAGGLLLDASCGSGLFSRRFARSGEFEKVIAMDFSANMLKQCSDFTGKDGGIAPGALSLVRADIARLPFETGSVDAVHAGAALHCWPNPQLAVAEISRILKPGGVWCASTFLLPTAPLGEMFGDANFRPLNQFLNETGIASARAYKFWEEQELKDLCEQAGLVMYERTRTRQFIMLSVRKPMADE